MPSAGRKITLREDAFRECVRDQKQSGRIIKLLIVQEILDEGHPYGDIQYVPDATFDRS